SSRRRHTRFDCDWSSDVCSSDLERELRTTYTNAYRIHTAPEEVVIDLGFNMANPNQQQPGQQAQLLFKVTDRVVMSYVNAKRLEIGRASCRERVEITAGDVLLQK